MGVVGLTEQQELLLTRIVLNRAMLGQCEGSDPPFLERGQTLWAWFGWKCEQEVHDYQATLLRVLGGQPRVQQALSQKDWYIAWRGRKYYLTYRKGLPARFIASLAGRLTAVATKREVHWLVAGIVIGMVVGHSILKPGSLLLPKLCVFVLSFCLYGFVAFLGGMFLFSKVIRSLEKDNSPWTTTQHFLLFVVLVVALAIGVSMGVWSARKVRPDNNPWREEVGQTYPY